MADNSHRRMTVVFFGMNRIPADTDPRSAFYIGQVMLCHVVNCQPDQAKLKISFKVWRSNNNQPK